MHDALFAHRQDLSRPSVLGIAKGLGLEMKRFEADLDSPQTKQTVSSTLRTVMRSREWKARRPYLSMDSVTTGQSRWRH